MKVTLKRTLLTVLLVLAVVGLTVCGFVGASAEAAGSTEATYPEGVTETDFGVNTVYAVYTKDGSQMTEYFTTLKTALEAIHNNGTATLYCKANADVGSMTHGHVCADLTVYGNGAYISGGEQEFELDTYMFCHYNTKTCETPLANLKELMLTVYNLNGAGAWGQRNSDTTLNITFNGCKYMSRVYLTSVNTTGVNNITLNDCTFTSNTSGLCKVYSNANGKVAITGCSFSSVEEGVNLNHKCAGEQIVEITDCTFDTVGTAEKVWAAPVRVLSSVEGATSTVTVSNTTFTNTVANSLGQQADILLDHSDNGTTVCTVTGTNANVLTETAENVGATVAVASTEAYNTGANVAAQYNGTNYASLEEAIAAATADTTNDNKTIQLLADATAADVLDVKNLTIDLNKHTLTLLKANSFNGNVELKNGSICITGCVASNGIFNIGDNETTTLTLTDIDLVGDGYKSDFAVLCIFDGSTLNVIGGTWTLANEQSTDMGGVIKNQHGEGSTGTVSIKNTKMTFTNVARGITGTTTTLEDAALTIVGGDNDINGATLTVKNSNVTITDGTGRGITVKDGSITIEGSTINLVGNAEGDILFRSNDKITVDADSTLNAATVALAEATGDESLNSLLELKEGATTNVHYAAQIGNALYATLAEAVEAANAGDTVVLVADVTLTDQINITKNVTIVGNGKAEGCYTITFTKSGYAFLIAAANVTFKDVRVLAANGGFAQTTANTVFTLQNSVVKSKDHGVDGQSSITVTIILDGSELAATLGSGRASGIYIENTTGNYTIKVLNGSKLSGDGPAISINSTTGTVIAENSTLIGVQGNGITTRCATFNCTIDNSILQGNEWGILFTENKATDATITITDSEVKGGTKNAISVSNSTPGNLKLVLSISGQAYVEGGKTLYTTNITTTGDKAIYISAAKSGSTLNISGAYVKSENEAGIYTDWNNKFSEFTISDSCIEAKVEALGLRGTFPAVTLTNTVMTSSKNKADASNNTYNTRTLYLQNAVTLNMTDCTVKNTGKEAVCIYVANGSNYTLNFKNVTLTGYQGIKTGNQTQSLSLNLTDCEFVTEHNALLYQNAANCTYTLTVTGGKLVSTTNQAVWIAHNGKSSNVIVHATFTNAVVCGKTVSLSVSGKPSSDSYLHITGGTFGSYKDSSNDLTSTTAAIQLGGAMTVTINDGADTSTRTTIAGVDQGIYVNQAYTAMSIVANRCDIKVKSNGVRAYNNEDDILYVTLTDCTVTASGVSSGTTDHFGNRAIYMGGKYHLTLNGTTVTYNGTVGTGIYLGDDSKDLQLTMINSTVNSKDYGISTGNKGPNTDLTITLEDSTVLANGQYAVYVSQKYNDSTDEYIETYRKRCGTFNLTLKGASKIETTATGIDDSNDNNNAIAVATYRIKAIITLSDTSSIIAKGTYGTGIYNTDASYSLTDAEYITDSVFKLTMNGSARIEGGLYGVRFRSNPNYDVTHSITMNMELVDGKINTTPHIYGGTVGINNHNENNITYTLENAYIKGGTAIWKSSYNEPTITQQTAFIFTATNCKFVGTSGYALNLFPDAGILSPSKCTVTLTNCNVGGSKDASGKVTAESQRALRLEGGEGSTLTVNGGYYYTLGADVDGKNGRGDFIFFDYLDIRFINVDVYCNSQSNSGWGIHVDQTNAKSGDVAIAGTVSMYFEGCTVNAGSRAISYEGNTASSLTALTIIDTAITTRVQSNGITVKHYNASVTPALSYTMSKPVAEQTGYCLNAGGWGICVQSTGSINITLTNINAYAKDDVLNINDDQTGGGTVTLTVTDSVLVAPQNKTHAICIGEKDTEVGRAKVIATLTNVAFSNSTYTSYHGLRLEGGEGSTLTIKGSTLKTQNDSLIFKDYVNVTLQNVTVESAGGWMVTYNQGTDSTVAGQYTATFESCTLTSSGRAISYLSGKNNAAATITLINTQVTANGEHGIAITQNSGESFKLQLTDSTIESKNNCIYVTTWTRGTDLKVEIGIQMSKAFNEKAPTLYSKNGRGIEIQGYASTDLQLKNVYILAEGNGIHRGNTDAKYADRFDYQRYMNGTLENVRIVGINGTDAAMYLGNYSSANRDTKVPLTVYNLTLKNCELYNKTYAIQTSGLDDSDSVINIIGGTYGTAHTYYVPGTDTQKTVSAPSAAAFRFSGKMTLNINMGDTVPAGTRTVIGDSNCKFGIYSFNGYSNVTVNAKHTDITSKYNVISMINTTDCKLYFEDCTLKSTATVTLRSDSNIKIWDDTSTKDVDESQFWQDQGYGIFVWSDSAYNTLSYIKLIDTDVTSHGSALFLDGSYVRLGTESDVENNVYGLTLIRSNLVSVQDRGIFFDNGSSTTKVNGVTSYHNTFRLYMEDGSIKSQKACIEVCNWNHDGNGETKKIVILMTDGDSTTSRYDKDGNVSTNGIYDLYSVTYRGINLRSSAAYTVDLDNVAIYAKTVAVYRTTPAANETDNKDNCRLKLTADNCVFIGADSTAVQITDGGDNANTMAFNATFTDCTFYGGNYYGISASGGCQSGFSASTLTIRSTTIDKESYQVIGGSAAIIVYNYVDVVIENSNLKSLGKTNGGSNGGESSVIRFSGNQNVSLKASNTTFYQGKDSAKTTVAIWSSNGVCRFMELTGCTITFANNCTNSSHAIYKGGSHFKPLGVETPATITLTDCKITAPGNVVRMDHSVITEATITINGGTLTSTNQNVIYVGASGSYVKAYITVKDATLTSETACGICVGNAQSTKDGKVTAVNYVSGSIVIENSTIKAPMSYAVLVKSDHTGSETTPTAYIKVIGSTLESKDHPITVQSQTGSEATNAAAYAIIEVLNYSTLKATATSGSGNGMWLNVPSKITVKDSTVSAVTNTGITAAYDTEIHIENSTIQSKGTGYALLLRRKSDITIQGGSTLQGTAAIFFDCNNNNSAKNTGMYDCTLTVKDSTLTGIGGQAIMVSENKTNTMKRLVLKNSTLNGTGAAVNLRTVNGHSSEIIIEGCKIVSTGSSGIYFDTQGAGTASVTVTDSVVIAKGTAHHGINIDGKNSTESGRTAISIRNSYIEGTQSGMWLTKAIDLRLDGSVLVSQGAESSEISALRIAGNTANATIQASNTEFIQNTNNITDATSVYAVWCSNGTLTEMYLDDCTITINGTKGTGLFISGSSFVSPASETYCSIMLSDCDINVPQTAFSFGNSGMTDVYISLYNCDVTTSSGACVNLGGAETANLFVAIVGGNYVTDTGMTIVAYGAANVSIVGGCFSSENCVIRAYGKSTVNVYSGYFRSGGYAVLNVYGYATMNVYGGRFVSTAPSSSADDAWHSVVSLGLGTDAIDQGMVNIYGGHFEGGEYLGQIFRKLKGRAINLYSMTCKGAQYIMAKSTPADGILMEYDNGTHSYSGRTPVMYDGAQLRLVETSGNTGGIRFATKIDKDTLDYATFMNKGESSVSYGTLIVPLDYLMDEDGNWLIGDFSLYSLEMAELPYLNIVAKDGIIRNADGSITLLASISEIKEQNYDRKFAAVGYVKYELDGIEQYLYSDFDPENNARSLRELARTALNDVTETPNATYRYETADGSYSRYTDAQRTLLSRYVGCNVTEDIIIAPTTTEPGLKRVYCSVCGTYYEEVIPVLETVEPDLILVIGIPSDFFVKELTERMDGTTSDYSIYRVYLPSDTNNTYYKLFMGQWIEASNVPTDWDEVIVYVTSADLNVPSNMEN